MASVQIILYSVPGIIQFLCQGRCVCQGHWDTQLAALYQNHLVIKIYQYSTVIC